MLRNKRLIVWSIRHTKCPSENSRGYFFCTCHTKSEQLSDCEHSDNLLYASNLPGVVRYRSDTPISPSANIFSFSRALENTWFTKVSRSNRAPRRALLDCTSLHFHAHPCTIMPGQRSYTSVVPGQKRANYDFGSRD